MASFRERPNGRWEARVYVRGRPDSRTFDTKRQAKEWAREQEVDAARNERNDPRLARITFDEWSEEWLGTIVHLRTVTRYGYELALRTHALPEFGRMKIGDVQHVDVLRFFARLQAEGLGPATLHRVRDVMRGVFELARKSGAIRWNPMDGLRLPRQTPAEPIILTAEQVDALARHTREPYDTVVRLTAATGMRGSEVCGLKVGRVNLLRSSIEIAEALTVVKGGLELGPTKSYATRTVGMGPSLRDEMTEYLAWKAHTLGRPLHGDEFVFTAPMGGPLRRDLFFKRMIRPAAKAAGLPDAFSFHDLRHTSAALLIALGAHPKTIQERLGHSSITVTMDVYGHLFPSIDEAISERLDDVLRKGRAEDDGNGLAGEIVPMR